MGRLATANCQRAMQYPSVTQILRPWQDFSGIPPEVLANAAERGTRVHAACAALALDLPVYGLAPMSDDLLYVESFQRWLDGTVAAVLAVEQEYIDHALGFRGHPDLVCLLKRSPDVVVVDIKTGQTFSRAWAVQLAAYAHLTGAQRCLTVRLKADGSRPVVNEITNWQREFAVFLNALSVYKYFNGGR